MTVAEFEQWQLSWDDACRYDLWDGEVIEMAPAGDAHGAIGTEIGRLVANYGRERRLGRTYMVETGFVLDEVRQRVLGPDVAFVTPGADDTAPAAGLLPRCSRPGRGGALAEPIRRGRWTPRLKGTSPPVRASSGLLILIAGP